MSSKIHDSDCDFEDHEGELLGNKHKYYVRSYQSKIDNYITDIINKSKSSKKELETEYDHIDLSTCTTLLCQAIKKHQDNTAIALLKRFPKINEGEKDTYKDLPLHAAVIAGNQKMTSKLLKSGARVDSTLFEGKQPLHLICDNKYTLDLPEYVVEDIIGILVKHGADVHAVESENGDTPLHLAIRGSIGSPISCLIKHGGISKHVNKQGKDILHEAFLSTSDNYKLIQTLISEGNFDLNLEDQNNFSVYKCAVSAYLELAYSRKDLKYSLYSSAKALKKVEFLLQNGASVNTVVDNLFGNNLFHSACQAKAELNLEFFLKYGADVNAKNKYGETPLHFCAKNHPLKCIESLIEHGSDINAITENGKTILHFAAENKDQCVLEYFLSLGLDKDIRDKNEKSALYYAVYSGQLNNTQILLNRYSNAQKAIIEQDCLLHVAIDHLHEDIVRLLLLYDVCIDCEDGKKQTIFKLLSEKLKETDPIARYGYDDCFGFNGGYNDQSDDSYNEYYREDREELEDEHDRAKEIRDILLLHTAKLVAMSCEVKSTSIKLLLSMDKKKVYQDYLRELSDMKKKNITKTVSLFKVLRSNAHTVATLIKNQSLKTNLFTIINSNKFPYYNDILVHVFKMAVLRNNLSAEAKKSLNRLLEPHNVQLMDEIFRLLFSYLTTLDLQHLASLYPDTLEIALQEVKKLEYPFI